MLNDRLGGLLQGECVKRKYGEHIWCLSEDDVKDMMSDLVDLYKENVLKGSMAWTLEGKCGLYFDGQLSHVGLFL